ncbi:PIN domain-containing protein [Rhizobium sp. FY34]|uniref:PIN domain-containing protein n=1 Tax=Rhizobium sp. FY34 TaxID=2562309 RepID=UPI0010BF69FC|nr:PIN domain-containing protein [Rhizobium sp. FY34]
MISTFTVFIDANVFFGARLRSLVLYMAQSKMFRARWTDKVHEEWMRNVADKRNIDISRLEKIKACMDSSVLNCLVTGYEGLEASFELPDPDDRHILAAAVKTRADMILTFNDRDFPKHVVEPLGIEICHPDDFLLDQFGISEELFIAYVREDFQHYKAPPLTFDRYIEDLRKAGVPKTAKLIEELRVLIEPE